jgi:cell division protein FtsW
MSTAWARTGRWDWPLLALTAVLLGAGLIMVYSASTILAMRLYSDPGHFILRQLVWAAVGLAVMVALARLPPARLREAAVPLLFLGLGLLVAVLALSFGRAAGGARRWLMLGPLSFQPAELLKVVMVVYLADALTRKQAQITSFRQGVLPPLLISAVVGGLLLLQPDLGTAVILVLLTVGMLFLGGARWTQLAALALAAAPVLVLLVASAGYRRRRWAAFLDPWQDPLGKGFQMIQSFLALGSGGLWGKGLCESQQKLFYLPAPHTDFIFSILGEELGFAGTFALLIVFGLLLAKGFAIAKRSADPFGKLLAGGLTLLIGLQMAVNVGVATGLFPTKGATLPFISAGGSSLLCTLAAIGLLLSVARALPEEG